MAKPIRATPTLRGEEAKRFVELMIKREKSLMSNIAGILCDDISKISKSYPSLH